MPSKYDPPSPRNTPSQSGTERGLLAGVGETVKVFLPPDIKATARYAPAITHFNPVTSYSWIRSVRPTILVPGCPTYYKGFRRKLSVEPDEGLEFVDKASTLLPDAPLLPLYEAIRFDDPDHDFSQYDIVTGRGELKKLLSWVLQTQKKEFRIEVEFTGDKGLILRRWEIQNVRYAGMGTNQYNNTALHYRTNFEKATCFPIKGNEESFSHWRVVSYDLCGLQMLIQCEVDAFTVKKSQVKSFAREHCPGLPKAVASDLASELCETALKTGKNQSGQGTTIRNTAALALVPYSGYETSHETLIELKTRSIKNRHPLEAKDIYSQAIWSRTPTTINALHFNGEFEEVETFKLDELEEMESTREVRNGVKKVGELLKDIIRLLQDEPAGSKFCLISKGPTSKELSLRKGGRGAGLTKNTFA